MFYTREMSRVPKPSPAILKIRIGSWFEACATGWGIVVVPLALMLAVVAVVLTKAG